MYIKLLCFNLESTVSRYLKVVLDGEEVLDKTEITSTDESAPDEFVIRTDKPAGIYKMFLSCLEHNTSDEGVLVVSKMLVSKDGLDWRDLRANEHNSNTIQLFDSESLENYSAKSPRHLWNFWYGIQLGINLEVPEDFEARYSQRSIESFIKEKQDMLDSFPVGSSSRLLIEKSLKESIARLSTLL